MTAHDEDDHSGHSDIDEVEHDEPALEVVEVDVSNLNPLSPEVIINQVWTLVARELALSTRRQQ